MCDALRARLSGGRLDLLEPCETWPVSAQEAIQNEASSPEAQRNRMKRWVDYVFDQSPALVEHKESTRTWLHQLLVQSDPMTVEQCVYLPFLARELGALGYAEARITNETVLHTPHATFRNEWWTLAGRWASGEALTWQVWRRTLVPPSQWEATVDPRLYSALRFSWTIQGVTRHSPWLLEGWGLGSVSYDPKFSIRCGRINRLTARQPDTLFPLDLSWAGVELLGLDHVKPVVMLHSNACLSCSDGIGIKMYMYPEVKNDQFSGFFTHAWEAGVMPEGFSSNAALRGIVNIERGLLYPRNVSRADQWFSLHVHLDNGSDLWAFFVSPEARHPHRVVSIQPTGAVTRLKAHEVELVRQNGLVSALLKSSSSLSSQFALHWVLDAPQISSTRQTLTTLSHGHVSGLWQDGFVKGAVVLETPDLRSYDQRAAEILREVFPQAGDRARRYFDRAYFATSSDVVTSVLIWLLPLLFALVVLLTTLYLTWSGSPQYPWIWKERTRSWWAHNN